MKIFCISYQRTGTTSVGQFFQAHGRRVATYRVNRRNGWTEAWFEGRHDDIFSSRDFIDSDVFEDDPWWCLDFYKILFHRFPDAKFVLFERDADGWFDSMVRHSQGRTLGNTYLHTRLYRREEEFEHIPEAIQSVSMYSTKIDMLLQLNELHRQHYKAVYKTRNAEIRAFFNRFGPDRLFAHSLDAVDKWALLGKFFEIDVAPNYNVHAHKARSA